MTTALAPNDSLASFELQFEQFTNSMRNETHTGNAKHAHKHGRHERSSQNSQTDWNNTGYQSNSSPASDANLTAFEAQLEQEVRTLLQTANYAFPNSMDDPFDDTSSHQGSTHKHAKTSKQKHKHDHPKTHTQTPTPPVISNQPVSQPAQSNGTWTNLMTRTENPFPYGQCTYGAEQAVYDATGQYMNLSTDAYLWKQQAQSRGYTVDQNATPQSVMVFQPGAQQSDPNCGHVAYVVKVDPTTHMALIKEMNYGDPALHGGFGKYDYRWVNTNDPNVSFIHLPSVTHPIPDDTGRTWTA